MKAIGYRSYGAPAVLECVEVPKPVPADDEVLVKVRAAGVNPLDWHLMRGRPYLLRITTGLSKPKVARLGVDVAGEVDAVGSRVSAFKSGDEVFGTCRGAFAEYACTSQSALVVKPERVTFEQAASVPVAAVTALQGLRDHGRIRTGHKVLINGAAGGVGTFGVQIAKALGAHVTGVCSARNVDLVRAIGADRVIDYAREDFTAGSDRYDLLLDCVGNHPVWARRRVLAPGGVCAIVGAPDNGWVILRRALAALLLSPFGDRKLVNFIAKVHRDDLAVVSEMMRAGTVTPVIDRQYTLTEVGAAIAYLEEGHARGKVVITVG